MFHVWPGSFDNSTVRDEDRATVHLDAGDIVFHGALVHESASQSSVDEHHMRLHFHTQSTHGRNAWPISNETERISRAD